MIKEPLFIVVDLFCGAGGTSTGFAMAEKGVAMVIACVNHDAKAIKSHWLNHPEVKHYEEDIRALDLTDLTKLAAYYRKKYPNAKLILWASLECTNFSKAKGGQAAIVGSNAGALLGTAVKWKYQHPEKIEVQRFQLSILQDEAIATAASAIRFLENLKEMPEAKIDTTIINNETPNQ